MRHPDEVVERAIIALSDAMCQWERATGRQSIIIIKEQGGFEYKAMNGKPDVPVDITARDLLDHAVLD